MQVTRTSTPRAAEHAARPQADAPAPGTDFAALLSLGVQAAPPQAAPAPDRRAGGQPPADEQATDADARGAAQDAGSPQPAPIFNAVAAAPVTPDAAPAQGAVPTAPAGDVAPVPTGPVSPDATAPAQPPTPQGSAAAVLGSAVPPIADPATATATAPAAPATPDPAPAAPTAQQPAATPAPPVPAPAADPLAQPGAPIVPVTADGAAPAAHGTPRHAADAAAVAAAAPASSTDAPTQSTAPAPATPVTASPTAPPSTPTSAPSTAYALQELQAVVQLAAARGSAQARIALRPAELGGLVIRMKATAEGVTATIRAEHPAAAAALGAAADDLRKSLEDRGLTVVSLDVGMTAGAGDSAADPRSAQAQAQADGRPGGARGTQTSSLDPDPDDLLETAPVVRLPAGALVDVQA